MNITFEEKSRDNYSDKNKPFYPFLRYRCFDDLLKEISWINISYGRGPPKEGAKQSKRVLLDDLVGELKIKNFSKNGRMVDISEILMLKSPEKKYLDVGTLHIPMNQQGEELRQLTSGYINKALQDDIKSQSDIKKFDPTPTSIVESDRNYYFGDANSIYTFHFFYYITEKNPDNNSYWQNFVNSAVLYDHLKKIFDLEDNETHPSLNIANIGWVSTLSPLFIAIYHTNLVFQRKLLLLPQLIGYYYQGLDPPFGNAVIRNNKVNNYVLIYEETKTIREIKTEPEFKSLAFQAIFLLETMFYQSGYINMGIAWNTLRLKGKEIQQGEGNSNEFDNTESVKNLKHKDLVFYRGYNVVDSNNAISPVKEKWRIDKALHENKFITLLPSYETEDYIPFPLDGISTPNILKMSPYEMLSHSFLNQSSEINTSRDKQQKGAIPSNSDWGDLFKWHISDIVCTMIVLVGIISKKTPKIQVTTLKSKGKISDEMVDFLKAIFSDENFFIPIKNNIGIIKKGLDDKSFEKDKMFKGFLLGKKEKQGQKGSTGELMDDARQRLETRLVEFEMFLGTLQNSINTNFDTRPAENSFFGGFYGFENIVENNPGTKGEELAKKMAQTIENLNFATYMGLFKNCLTKTYQGLKNKSLLSLSFFKEYQVNEELTTTVFDNILNAEGLVAFFHPSEMYMQYVEENNLFEHRILGNKPDYTIYDEICSK